MSAARAVEISVTFLAPFRKRCTIRRRSASARAFSRSAHSFDDSGSFMFLPIVRASPTRARDLTKSLPRRNPGAAPLVSPQSPQATIAAFAIIRAAAQQQNWAGVPLLQNSRLSDTMPAFARTLLAEGLGTFILVLFGCGAVHSAVLTGAQSGLWQVAIVWGSGVAFAAYCVGGISGAHVNPAMTIALAVWGRFPWAKVAPYIAVQMAGAILAAAALFVIYGPNLKAKEEALGVRRGDAGSMVTASCYGEFYPNPGGAVPADGKWSDSGWATYKLRVTFLEAFVAEVLCTAVLALVVFAVTDG